MSDPAFALQKAFFVALKGNTEAGENVFDRVPTSKSYPRITIGEGQSIGNVEDCYEGTESFSDVHVWTSGVGFLQAKRIVGEIRGILHDAELDLEGHTLELIEFQTARYLNEPDGLSCHAIMTFRTLTQPSF